VTHPHSGPESHSEPTAVEIVAVVGPFLFCAWLCHFRSLSPVTQNGPFGGGHVPQEGRSTLPIHTIRWRSSRGSAKWGAPGVAPGRKWLAPYRWRTERSGIGRRSFVAGSRPSIRRSVETGVSTDNAPAISRRCGQVVVVSPILVQAAFDCALSSTVGGTPHTAGQGLLPGRRPFHQIPREPPVRHLHRTLGLCRCCSVARTLARRAPARPRVPRSGDFPQRSVVTDAYHRQLPSTSWRIGEGGTSAKSLGRAFSELPVG
jgi:hypothetical protein